MKKVDINCIIDMSGSMCNIIESARKGFNNFLDEQKRSNSKIKFSLMLFDNSLYMPYKNVNIKNVKELDEDTYYARGGTALYDCLGSMIEIYLDNLSNIPKNKRADKTLFVIITDGEENSSKYYSRDLIKNMVSQMRNDFNCEFIYLGANQDACFQAETIGINRNNAFNYEANDDGITVAYSNMSKATSYYVDTEEKENLFQQ